MDSAQKPNKQEKIDRAVQLLEQSGGMSTIPMKLSSNQWAGILSKLQEDRIDELLLILDEEQSMKALDDQTSKRKEQVNKTRYLHRLEKLKILLEQEKTNPPSNV